jgi:hypothetical protein
MARRIKVRLDGTSVDAVQDQLEQEVKQDIPLTSEEAFTQLRQSLSERHDMPQLYLDPKENSVEPEFNLASAEEFLTLREKLQTSVAKAIQHDPTLFKGLSGAILEGGTKATGSLLQAVGRTLNFVTAREAGLARGLIKWSRGEGTVLDGVREGVRDNIGFAEVLDELDVFEDDKGKKKELFNLFGWTPTQQGATGLVLDILLDPLTYLSLGLTTPAKVAARQGLKQGARSVARFAGKTLLTDTQLVKGINAMKATPVGQATMNAIDAWAASKLGKGMAKLGEEVATAFIPGHGQNKILFEHLNAANRSISRQETALNEALQRMAKEFTPQEKILYFTAKFRAMRSERTWRDRLVAAGLEGEAFQQEAKKFGKRLFPANPKMQELDDLLFDAKDGLFTKLADEAGIPAEISFQNYMHSAFEQIGERTIKGRARKTQFKQVVKTGATKHKGFAEDDLIRDPFISMGQVGSELIRMKEIRKVIKTTARAFGENFPTDRVAQEAGYHAWFPENTLRFFRKEVAEGQDVLAVARKKPTYIPNEVMRTIDDFTKRNNITTNQALKLYDGFSQQFKSWVTSPWPAFLYLQATSNRILRFVNEGWKAFHVVDDADAIKMMMNHPEIQTKTFKYGKSDISLATAKEWAKRDGITETSQFWTDLGGGALDKVSSRQLGRFANYFNLNASKNNYIKLSRRVGEAIEDEAKLASYVRALKDGATRQEAKQIAHAGLFDYSNLTAFEKQWMRRIFPFYTFTRKNIELQVQSMLKNPGRQAMMFKLQNDLQKDALSDLNDKELAAFNAVKFSLFKNAFAFPVGADEKGNIMWATGFNWPQEDAVNLFSKSGAWFRLNPVIKTVIEQGLGTIDIGRTLASGSEAIGLKESYEWKELRPIFTRFVKDSASQEEVKKFVNSPQFQNNPFVQLMGLKVFTKAKYEKGAVVGKEYAFQANPRVITALRNTFVARFLSTVRSYGDPNIEDTQLLVKFLTGFSIIKQDLDQSAAFERNRLKRETVDVLKRAGTEGGYTFETPVAAKGAPESVKQLIQNLNRELRKD